jgi:hypothetical protein
MITAETQAILSDPRRQTVRGLELFREHEAMGERVWRKHHLALIGREVTVSSLEGELACASVILFRGLYEKYGPRLGLHTRQN